MASRSDLTPLTGWSSEGMAINSNRPRPISRASASQFSSFKEKDALLHSTQAYGSPITHPAISVRSVMGRRTSQDDAVAVQLNLLQVPDQKSAQQQQDPTGLAMECGHATSPTPMQTDSTAAVPMFHFAGVFDGHGGSAVSNHCANHMASILRSQLFSKLTGDAMPVSPLHPNDSNPDSTSTSPAASAEIGDAVLQCITPSTDNGHSGSDRFQLLQELSEEQVTDALIQSFAICDAGIPAVSASEGGSTAVCALLSSDRVWVANCGDSRALIGRRGRAVISLSTDHKPERPDEAARIQAAGGLVFWNAGHRVMGVLNMSRAMGDMYLKQYGVIAVPEVMVMPRTEDDEFLLLASDGLWSSLSNEEAVALAAECIERAHKRGADRTAALRIAAQVLVKAALQQGSSDNISVVMVDLRTTSDVDPEQQMQEEVGNDITLSEPPQQQSHPTSQPTTNVTANAEADCVQHHNPVQNTNTDSELPAQADVGFLGTASNQLTNDQAAAASDMATCTAQPVEYCNAPTVTTCATPTGLSFGSVISVQRQPSHDMITTCVVSSPDIAVSASPARGDAQDMHVVQPDSLPQHTAEPVNESMETQADNNSSASLVVPSDNPITPAFTTTMDSHMDVARPAALDLPRISAPAFVSGESLSIPSPMGNRVFGRSYSSSKSRLSLAPGLSELSKLAKFRSCSMPRDVAVSSSLARESCGSPLPPSLERLTVSPGKRSHSEPPEAEHQPHVPSPTKRSRMYQTAQGIIPHLTLAAKLGRPLSRSSHSPLNPNPCLDKSIERLLVTVDSP